MEQILTSTLHTCRHCLKELPAEAFYMDKRTRRPESCCKACRSAAYRKRYIDSHFVNTPSHATLIITDVQDRKQRMTLILHALQVVKESVTRKRRKLIETSLSQES
ncbi:hypothetical protein [Bacteroides sp. MSB163]|jgi:hypothetical protein|uniref:hypothetical protein n=1 Tax=Bacteroides maternus TaxID=3117552 RepID=UPI002ED8B0CF